MSKRIDISGEIFNDIYVLTFIRNRKTHALYKCLCMICNETFDTTYSNLISKNTKSCQSCGQKVTNYKQNCEIMQRIKRGDYISHIAEDYEVSRSVINRIKTEGV